MEINYTFSIWASDSDIKCLAMAIVNKTNESNNVDVQQRQLTNDSNFDFAVEKIEEFLKNLE
jgi:hypothetical protein